MTGDYRLMFGLNLTIIVDPPIIVLVSVPHQFLQVILSDALARRVKHHPQLLQIYVAIFVPGDDIFRKQNLDTYLCSFKWDGHCQVIAVHV